MTPIVLLPSASEYSPEQLRARVTGDICACDFYVTGAEQGDERPGGYLVGGVLNIDHHAPGARMARHVSSATLAIAHVRAEGPPPGTIVINHTDCDSILSAGIASGHLPPEDRFSDAAIAADHTCADNEVADLLQSLDSRRDIRLSLRNLQLLLRDEALDDVAKGALRERRRKRDAARDLVRRGRVVVEDGIAIGLFDEPLDAEFFPSLLPEARLVMLVSPIRGSTKREVKLRLGNRAPQGLTLHALDVRGFDPAWGGRWNAGSNKRAGGTDIPPDKYAAEVRRRLARAIGDRGHGSG